MSLFEVKFRTIDNVERHPNADALDLAVIGGYKAVVKRDEFVAGDTALYIPDDTLFEDISIAECLGIAPYLTGKQKNRVKPVRLRGELSQGIVVPIAKITDCLTKLGAPSDVISAMISEKANIAAALKTIKYEEPIPIHMAGKIRPWPGFLCKYDVENIKRPESMLAMIEGEEVVVTEKLHGTNMSVATEDGMQIFVCSRNNALEADETNVYWRAARQYNLVEKIEKLFNELMVQNISLHGEVVGVQDLKYGFNGGNVGFFAFDIRANGEFLPFVEFERLCTKFEIPMVPILYRGPYSYNTIAELAAGKTALGNNHIREGVVARPIVERYVVGAGRVQFKFINEDYLTRKGGTEMH